MADLIGFLVANPSASVPEDGVDNDLRQYAKLAEEEPSSQWELGDGQIPLSQSDYAMDTSFPQRYNPPHKVLWS